MTFHWIILILFALYAGPFHVIWGGRRFHARRTRLVDGSPEKGRFYLEEILSLWAPALVVFLPLLMGTMETADYGIAWPALPWGWVSIGAAVVAGLYGAFLVYQIVALRVCAARGLKARIATSPDLDFILPRGGHEKRLYALVSASAGITEELMFRGYFNGALVLALGSLGAEPWLAVGAAGGVSAAFFGAMHLYLGRRQVLNATAVGLFYSALSAAFGSILPLMLLHSLQDLTATDIKDVRDMNS